MVVCCLLVNKRKKKTYKITKNLEENLNAVYTLNMLKLTKETKNIKKSKIQESFIIFLYICCIDIVIYFSGFQLFQYF